MQKLLFSHYINHRAIYIKINLSCISCKKKRLLRKSETSTQPKVNWFNLWDKNKENQSMSTVSNFSNEILSSSSQVHHLHSRNRPCQILYKIPPLFLSIIRWVYSIHCHHNIYPTSYFISTYSCSKLNFKSTRSIVKKSIKAVKLRYLQI